MKLKLILILVFTVFSSKISNSESKPMDSATYYLRMARIDYFIDLRLRGEVGIIPIEKKINSFIINPENN